MSEALPTILVADDTPTNVELVNLILDRDHEVLVATSGPEALRIAQSERPDLILLDVMMPGLNGLETCRRLKADPITRGIPVLFLTALSDPSDLVNAFAAGGLDYISKPFHPEELRARVSTHLALARALTQERTLRAELEAALARVKQLSGLLPICAQCKKIRDTSGSWSPLESYISEHSEADFTHGLCPDCAAAFRSGMP